MKKLNQKGQGMTEYILIVALIAVSVIGAVKFFGRKTQDGFNSAGKDISKAISDGHSSGQNDSGR